MDVPLLKQLFDKNMFAQAASNQWLPWLLPDLL